jgi:Mn-dependent DtxR family transcriptional regulator
MYHKIKSRAGQYRLAMVVIKQLMAQEKAPTSYALARPLDVSQPTARRLLKEMEKAGLLEAKTEAYKNTMRTSYNIIKDDMSSSEYATIAQALNMYWMENHV